MDWYELEDALRMVGKPRWKYALQDAAVRDILLRDGSEIVASRPEDFREVIANDYAKYGKMADLLMSAK